MLMGNVEFYPEEIWIFWSNGELNKLSVKKFHWNKTLNNRYESGDPPLSVREISTILGFFEFVREDVKETVFEISRDCFWVNKGLAVIRRSQQ